MTTKPEGEEDKKLIKKFYQIIQDYTTRIKQVLKRFKSDKTGDNHIDKLIIDANRLPHPLEDGVVDRLFYELKNNPKYKNYYTKLQDWYAGIKNKLKNIMDKLPKIHNKHLQKIIFDKIKEIISKARQQGKLFSQFAKTLYNYYSNFSRFIGKENVRLKLKQLDEQIGGIKWQN